MVVIGGGSALEADFGVGSRWGHEDDLIGIHPLVGRNPSDLLLGELVPFDEAAVLVGNYGRRIESIVGIVGSHDVLGEVLDGGSRADSRFGESRDGPDGADSSRDDHDGGEKHARDLGDLVLEVADDFLFHMVFIIRLIIDIILLFQLSFPRLLCVIPAEAGIQAPQAQYIENAK
jgi:hypothetical protein